jgi:hypothetical protein
MASSEVELGTNSSYLMRLGQTSHIRFFNWMGSSYGKPTFKTSETALMIFQSSRDEPGEETAVLPN